MITLPTSTIAGIEVPQTPLISRCVEYLNEKNTPSIIHHSIRSALWSLIICNKVPRFKDLKPESIIVANLLHDIGWSMDPSIRSTDKRFEVDGANAAREFITAETSHTDGTWDEPRLQAIWDSIALHATPSIASHSQPIVHLVNWGIKTDFMGPFVPGNVVTVEEYKEVLQAYPRIGFQEELTEIICGLCKTKPGTTYDNFAADFGRVGVEGYKEEWEKRRIKEVFEASLKACEQYEM